MPDLDERSSILDAVRDTVETYFGPAAEVEADRVLRKVSLGPWMGHEETMLPKCTVLDAGQTRDESREIEGGSFLKLRVKLIFDLLDNWDREESMQQWSGVMQRINARLHFIAPTDVAIETVDLVQDNPWEFVIGSASAFADWVMEIEVTYFRGYGED